MRVFLAFWASFYVAVVLLDFVSLVVLVVAVVVAIGMRDLAQRASKKINSDMLVQNLIEKLNRIFSKSKLITSFAQNLREMFLGVCFQLAVTVREIKAINLSHICLTPRFFPTPIIPLPNF